jgi:hypothetical protein
MSSCLKWCLIRQYCRNRREARFRFWMDRLFYPRRKQPTSSKPLADIAAMPFGPDCRGRVAQYHGAFPVWATRGGGIPVGGPGYALPPRGNRRLWTTADAATLWSIAGG